MDYSVARLPSGLFITVRGNMVLTPGRSTAYICLVS